MKNLLKNGNFEIAPPFVAATSTNARWIDGTAAGSTTQDGYLWALLTRTTSGSAQFDSTVKRFSLNSLKLSLPEVNSVVAVMTSPSISESDIKKYGIPVLPNTTYVCTFYMKTSVTSGDSDDGANINFFERNGVGGGLISNVSTPVKMTTDWTQYTVTIETSVNTRFLTPKLQIVGNTGTASLIMDAWFDEITVSRMTPPPRRLAVPKYKFNQGNRKARILELDDGTWISIFLTSNLIEKSTNQGLTWTTKATLPAGFCGRTSFLMKDGTTIFVTALNPSDPTVFATLYRSTDSGETWELVLTGEGNAMWYVTEDSMGAFYVNEYSYIQDLVETNGRNVWKSSDGGDTWSKFYTAPSDLARHVHLVAVDSFDNVYITYGDVAVTGRRSMRFDTSGNLIDILSETDGFTAFAESPSGIFFGEDTVPSRIWKYDPVAKVKTQAFCPRTSLGIEYDELFFSGVVTKDGRVFFNHHGERSANLSVPFIFASKDGMNWERIDGKINHNLSADYNTIRSMTCNPRLDHPKLFLEYPNFNYHYIQL